jgi:two-component system response regulator GlrR
MGNRIPADPAEVNRPTQRRDTIQILGEGFPPGQFNEVLEILEGEGHCCAPVEGVKGIRTALSDPRTKLLLLSIKDGDGQHVAEVVGATTADTHNVPILIHCSQCAPAGLDELLTHDINDVVLGPLNLQELCLRVNRLTRKFLRQRREAEQVHQNLLAQLGRQQFVGDAPAFRAVLDKVPRVASCDVPVLIIGETGTGKEMCARAIHYLSPRANMPFIPVNCGAIPPELFENEMFGHESGAYTDARRSQRGQISMAEGGTLFLDEVDSLPLPTQVKLLRFLQDRQYKPLGSLQFRQADTRLLTATNKKLPELVKEGRFREDLFYRLKVVSLELPTLQERKEDIPALASHFIETAAREYRRPVMRLTPEAAQKLLTYAWPGNVRELENVIRHGIVMSEGGTLRAQDIQLNPEAQEAPVPWREPFNAAKARAIETFERSYISELVAACGGNISRAAREAKKDRRAFFALLKKYGMTSAKRPMLTP